MNLSVNRLLFGSPDWITLKFHLTSAVPSFRISFFFFLITLHQIFFSTKHQITVFVLSLYTFCNLYQKNISLFYMFLPLKIYIIL